MRLNVSSYRKIILPTIVILIFLLAGCIPPTKVTGTWKKEGYIGEPFTSILVVGLGRDKNNSILWENVVADGLQQNGVIKVVTTSSVFPNDKQISRDGIINYVNENNIEGVLVTRFIDAQKERAYSPSSGEYFGSYYNRYYDNAYGSPHYIEATVVLLETTLFKSETKEMIWSMSSDTFDPRSVSQIAKEVSNKIIRRLKRDQLI